MFMLSLKNIARKGLIFALCSHSIHSNDALPEREVETLSNIYVDPCTIIEPAGQIFLPTDDI